MIISIRSEIRTYYEQDVAINRLMEIVKNPKDLSKVNLKILIRNDCGGAEELIITLNYDELKKALEVLQWAQSPHTKSMD